MKRTVSPPKPVAKVDMRCSCGSTISGSISPSFHAAGVRDIFMSFHRGDGCVVTDKSTHIGGELVS